MPIYAQTSDKYQACLNIFTAASAEFIRLKSKYTNKRAENMKFTSIFYKASAVYIRR